MTALKFFNRIGTRGLASAALILGATAGAQAAGDPRGIWYDHNGRGAVEIKSCKSNPSRLCGHVVYVKKARNKKRCGMQIIGNVRKNGRGWIYSPSRGRSYPLAVKRLSNNRLRIIGNAGSFFTKKYVWKRAPDTIANCPGAIVAKAQPEPQTEPTTPKVKSVKIQKSEPENVAEPAPVETAKTDPIETGTVSTGSAALLATTRVAAPQPEPVENPEPETAEQADGNDLAPPGGLSKGGDPKLEKLSAVIKKFTGGKGLKLKGKGGKCKFRIPYVGRTIRVPCK